jgi:hypothetical protein
MAQLDRTRPGNPTLTVSGYWSTKTKRTKTKHLAPIPRWVYHADNRTCSTTPAREFDMLTPGSGFLELKWVRQ